MAPQGGGQSGAQPAAVLSAIAPLCPKFLRGSRAQGPALTCPQRAGEGKEETLRFCHLLCATDLTYLVSSNLHRTHEVQHYCPRSREGNRVPGRSCMRGGVQPSNSGLSDSTLSWSFLPPTSHNGGTVSVTDQHLRVTLRSGILAEVQFEPFWENSVPAFTSGTGEIWKEALAPSHMTVWPCPAFC